MVRFYKYEGMTRTAVIDMHQEMETICAAIHKIDFTERPSISGFYIDGGGEFLSNQLSTWLKGRGINQEIITPYSLESNGQSRRLNRTLNDVERSAMTRAPNLLKNTI